VCAQFADQPQIYGHSQRHPRRLGAGVEVLSQMGFVKNDIRLRTVFLHHRIVLPGAVDTHCENTRVFPFIQYVEEPTHARTHAFLLLAFGHIQRIAKFTKHDRGKTERRPKKFFINQ